MNLVKQWIENALIYFRSKMKQEVLWCWTITIAVGITVVPLIVAGFYNHPVADDYSFGYTIYHAIKKNEGIAVLIGIITAVWKKVIDYYLSWGGYYTSILISALRPSIFSESLSFTHPIIMIGALFICNYYALKNIVNKKMQFSKSTSYMLTCVTGFLMVQFVPSSAETLYWFNGGVSYTLLFALSLILMTRTYNLLDEERISIGKTVSLSIFSFVIAGGHYPVTFPTLCILFFVFIDAISNKKISRKNKYTVISIFVFFVVGFIITVIAPGNYIRMGYTESNGVAKTIIMSIHGCWCLVRQFLSPQMMLGGIAVVFLTIRFRRKTSFCVKMPGYITLVSFCIMIAAYIPGYFASNIQAQNAGGRYQSVMFFYFVFLFVINVVYYTEWVLQKMQEKSTEKMAKASAMIICSVGLCIMTISFGNLTQQETWAVSGLLSLKNGELQQFDKEMDERVMLYEDAEQNVITIRPVTIRPQILFVSDISNTYETWMINSIARYYEKEEVIVDDEFSKE